MEKRWAAAYAVAEHELSATLACGLMGIERSSYYYEGQPRSDEPLRSVLKEAGGIGGGITGL